MKNDADLERLASLGRATHSVRAGAGFDSWVLQQLPIGPRVTDSGLWRGIFLGAFAFAALCAVVSAQAEQRRLETVTLTLLDSLDVAP